MANISGMAIDVDTRRSRLSRPTGGMSGPALHPIAVRMVWGGVPVINVPTRVRYVPREEGGVSHFRLGRDNVLISWMHTRLMIGFGLRLPLLLWRRRRRLPPFQP